MFLVAVLPRAARLSICVWAEPNLEPKAVNPKCGGHSLVFKEQVSYCLLMGGGSYVLDLYIIFNPLGKISICIKSTAIDTLPFTKPMWQFRET